MQSPSKTQLPPQLQRLIRRTSKSKVLQHYLKTNPHPDPQIVELLKKKPVRSLSGVTPVTVLTKPYPCPGECIFCPADVRMPKSYIASEPGAQRAAQNGFDPYLQVYNRLQAYSEIGHPVSKIELIILGGTWSVYPEDYQIWFVTRLFQALNDFGEDNDNRHQPPTINLNDVIDPNETYNQHIAQKTTYLHAKYNLTWNDLFAAHHSNQSAHCRCVGLVFETRPDYVTPVEVIKLRRFGATKIQIGIQSLQNKVLQLNKRGHNLEQTENALNLLRQAGFKIHAHWMPNLYGSTPELDKQDFLNLFSNPNICPDELKVYPCSLIDHTELMNIYHQGLWRPYSQQELVDVLTFALLHTPEYCRLTRIIRDIPGSEIVVGNKTTNLRQLLEQSIPKTEMHDIRAREIKRQTVAIKDLFLDKLVYQTATSTEIFLQYITSTRQIAGFLRLSLPQKPAFISELTGRAIIREVHVYGQSLTIGHNHHGKAQHQGLGKKLITQAISLAKHSGYRGIAVISAIGTRLYYQKLGFTLKDLYQHLDF